MWSPFKNANGARNPFYDNMDKVQPGDLVFAYAQQQVKAIGVAQKRAYSAPKPASFENASNNWSQIGWLVEVEFSQLDDPVVPKEHLQVIGQYLTTKSAPLDETGRGKERYLVELEEGLALAMIQISKAPLELMTRELAPVQNSESDYEIELEIQDNSKTLKQQYKEAVVSIEGHTDNVGDPAKNKDLSQRRADSVKRYLTSQGVAAERLTATGFGQEKPIADNRTAPGRAKNRRVDFVLSY